MDGSAPVRLGDGFAMALSPDARSVLVSDNVPSSLESDPQRVAVMPTGAGEPRPLRSGKIASYFDGWWASDGQLLLTAREAGRPLRLFVQSLSDGEPAPITPEGVVTATPTISPDSRWVAAKRLEAGSRYELYPIAGGEPRPIPGLLPRETPLGWTPDGRSLFVRVSEDRSLPVRIEKLDPTTGRRAPWLSLAPSDSAGVQSIPDGFIQLSADGRGYVYSYSRQLGELYVVDGLR